MKCRKCKKEIPDISAYCLYCGAKQEIAQTRRGRGNGQGTAYKRGRTWTAMWTCETFVDASGNLHQRRSTKGGFPSKTAALAFAANPVELQAKDAYRPTLNDYYKGWSTSAYNALSKSKQCAYDIAWKRMDALKNIPMLDLTINNLQSCVDSQVETFYPARDMKTLFSQLYKRAVAEGQARTNLAEFIELPPLEETEQKPFTEDEIKSLWKAYDGGDKFLAFPLLMIYSGMMPGELLRCTSDMIHTDTHEIIGCGLKTKKRKETPLIYPDWLGPLVLDILSNVKSQKGYIVGMNADNFYTEYHAALARAKVRDLPPYSCRHTTATALALAKTAPSLIQEIMRHTKFSTTQRYIHPDMQSAHDAINVLDKGAE